MRDFDSYYFYFECLRLKYIFNHLTEPLPVEAFDRENRTIDHQAIIMRFYEVLEEAGYNAGDGMVSGTCKVLHVNARFFCRTDQNFNANPIAVVTALIEGDAVQYPVKCEAVVGIKPDSGLIEMAGR